MKITKSLLRQMISIMLLTNTIINAPESKVFHKVQNIDEYKVMLPE